MQYANILTKFLLKFRVESEEQVMFVTQSPVLSVPYC